MDKSSRPNYIYEIIAALILGNLISFSPWFLASVGIIVTVSNLVIQLAYGFGLSVFIWCVIQLVVHRDRYNKDDKTPKALTDADVPTITDKTFLDMLETIDIKRMDALFTNVKSLTPNQIVALFRGKLGEKDKS